MTSRFLITGGAGFIGSHLADQLQKLGAGVVVLDDLSTGRREHLSAEIEFINGSVLDTNLITNVAKGCTGIFHLAAIASVSKSNEDWIGSHRVNQTGTLAVFNASRALGGMPVVYASSAAVYGNQRVDRITEQAVVRPLSPYGADKLGCELHGHVAATLFGIPNIGLRFFNVYGPRQESSSPYSGVISVFTAKALSNLPITIYGDGRQTRDFINVADVVSYLIAAMKLSKESEKTSGVFNVCTGKGKCVIELAEMIISLLNSSSVILYGPPRFGDIEISVGNPDAARHSLGITANIGLNEGLCKMMGIY